MKDPRRMNFVQVQLVKLAVSEKAARLMPVGATLEDAQWVAFSNLGSRSEQKVLRANKGDALLLSVVDWVAEEHSWF